MFQTDFVKIDGNLHNQRYCLIFLVVNRLNSLDARITVDFLPITIKIFENDIRVIDSSLSKHHKLQLSGVTDGL
jgi:hypothetical protein